MSYGGMNITSCVQEMSLEKSIIILNLFSKFILFKSFLNRLVTTYKTGLIIELTLNPSISHIFVKLRAPFCTDHSGCSNVRN
jgi:hypothetical protein